jgi:hypothetical protein
MAPFSQHTLRSFQTAREGWVYFYMYSIVIFLLSVGAFSLAIVPFFMISSLGALGIVVTSFLYSRLLGRLMWYAAHKEAKLETERAAASGATS